MTLKTREKISLKMEESKIDRFKYRDYNPEIVEEHEKTIVIYRGYHWCKYENNTDPEFLREKKSYNYGLLYNNFDIWLSKNYFHKETLNGCDIERIRAELRTIMELLSFVKASTMPFQKRLNRAVDVYRKNICDYQKNPSEFVDDIVDCQKSLDLLCVAQSEYYYLRKELLLGK